MPQIVNHKGHEGPPGKKAAGKLRDTSWPWALFWVCGLDRGNLTHPTTPDFAKKRYGLYDGTHSNP
jgi:hypothetical protein